ncbi:ferredoxin--NADP reductase [Parasediminibacterium paludis]|uniref:Ferredoxin--NADP reductase n=1 Tax=Parasediminibacterium paludis TaxID=908966 RepID=A0ABV8Q0B3_9BACT
MTIYTLSIIDKRIETNDTVTLVFKQPGLKKIAYLPGQYLTLIFKINGRRYLRPYSLSSTPVIDKFLEVTVKRVPHGIVSNHVCDIVSVGDVIEVLQPMGDFVLPNAPKYENYAIVLWGAGSGITPLFSIAKQVLHSGHCQVVLVYGNRTIDNVIFKTQIEILQQQHPDRFTVWNFYTQLDEAIQKKYCLKGRILPDLVLNSLSKNFDLTESLHYICGPNGLKLAVKKALNTYTIHLEQIFSEDFELVKNDADFVDIRTQFVTINQNGIDKVVEVVKGKSILEAGLDALIEMPYSCQTGNCSICKGKLLNGNVKQVLPKHPDLTVDEYQLCCTYPLSSEIVISI